MSLLHQIALTLIPGVGDLTARNLLSYCGSPEEVFKAKISSLITIPGIGPLTAKAIKHHSEFDRAEKELQFIERYKIQTFFVTDKLYPARLKNCVDAPLLLYFKGAADLNASKVISVVGTRKATEYGKELCRQLVDALQIHNPLVISGLAYGIDSMVHKECIKHSVRTVGVLGHGLDRIYPAVNRSMAEKMLSCGGLLTEFPSTTIPDRENFPKRNRIIAGMADATIVVEASIKGGALITAELANSYNRDVFAYPGRINDEYSTGCNFLIKTNRASLITKVADLEYLLGWSEVKAKQERPQLSLMLNLTDDEKKVATILNNSGSLAVDELAIQSEMAQSKLAVTILGMEMQGLIISLPGKVYKMA